MRIEIKTQSLAYLSIASTAIVQTLLLSSACLNIDGTNSHDGPIMTHELHGEWCTFDKSTCLRVINPELDDRASYYWITPDCGEDGIMTGGLEFTPTLGRCFGWPEYPGLYSAAGRWQAPGMVLEVDGLTEPLWLDYNSEWNQ
jgi:hypothetical protein